MATLGRHDSRRTIAADQRSRARSALFNTNWRGTCIIRRGRSDVTKPSIRVASCFFTLSILGVAWKAEALPILLSVQSGRVATVTVIESRETAFLSGAHGFGFGGDWLTSSWRGGTGFSFGASSLAAAGSGGGFLRSANGSSGSMMGPSVEFVAAGLGSDNDHGWIPDDSAERTR